MNELKKHQLIAFSSFIILAGVLYYLTYNTFVLKDRQYQLHEKELLKDSYRKYVENGNLYPGGYAIVSKYIEANIFPLEALYKRSGTLRSHYSDSLLLGMFKELSARNPMDGVFDQFKRKHGLDQDLNYLLTINSIKIRFDRGLIVPIYEEQTPNPFLDRELTKLGKQPKHFKQAIGGNLKSPMAQNLITSLHLSSSVSYSYDITFSFYADTEDRYLNIFKSALPVLLLALLTLIATISVYYITFKNWIRQKKLAEMKSDFINSITHEFNTPISTILVANKNLQIEKVREDKRNIIELTEIIARQSSRLQHLFSQVLDVTQMDNHVEKEAVDFARLLRETVKDYQLKTAHQHIRIHLSVKESTDQIYLNKFWVTTMLFNIFDNAVKYNESTEKRIDILLKSTESEHWLTIADNGIGMEEHTVKNMFDKFYRGNRKSPVLVSGLGLGLYYVQQCIEVHAWKLTVDTVFGEGSKFNIIIPIHL